jgi:hypothetical protein
MGKKFRYENPLLIDLREDLSCRGVGCTNGTGGACSTGSDIGDYECGPGSCATNTLCGQGSKAESCCSGTTACSTWNFGTCESGSSVSGSGGSNYTCQCVDGSRAGMACTSGTLALGWGCGCGGNNGGYR